MAAQQPKPIILRCLDNSVVNTVIFINDDTGETSTMLTGHSSGEILTWHLKTKRVTNRVLAHKSSSILHMGLVPMSYDDKHRQNVLVTQGREGLIKIWDTDFTSQDKEPQQLMEISTGAEGFCKYALCVIQDPTDAITTSAVDTASKDKVPQAIATRLWIIAPNNTSELLNVWDVSEGTVPELKATLTPKADNKTGMCMAIAIPSQSCSLSRIAFGLYEDGNCFMWQLSGRKSGQCLANIQLHSQVGLSLMVTCDPQKPNRFRGVSGAANGEVTAFSFNSEKTSFKVVSNWKDVKESSDIKSPGISAIAVRGDGRIISIAGWDKCTRVYSAKTLTLLAVLDEHPHSVTCTGFTPDKEYLFSASQGRIQLWNVYPPKSKV